MDGLSPKEQKYYVNPFRRDLERDLRSSRGVSLSSIEEYEDYSRKKSLKSVEQEPCFDGPGELELKFEGSVRHLKKDSPNFYDITGLPKSWPIGITF